MNHTFRSGAILMLAVILVACVKSAPIAPYDGFNLLLTSNNLTLNQGDTADLPVTLERKHGFTGEVTLTLTDPPVGVTGEGAIPEGETTGVLSIFAQVTTSPADEVPITVEAEAQINGQTVTQTRTLTLTIAEVATPQPHHVQVVPDENYAVTQVVPTTGGNLQTAGADGTLYTLEIPEGALLSDEKITMTPIIAIGDLPLAGGYIAAVQLEPDGLRLYESATLTIEPAIGTYGEGRVVGFNSHGMGTEFHFQPHEAHDEVYVLNLDHFSNPGVAFALDDDLFVPLVPTDSEDQQAHKRAQEDATDAMLEVSYYAGVLKPALLAAKTQPAGLDAVMAKFIAWVNYVKRNALADDLTAEVAEGWNLLAQALESSVAHAHGLCVTNTDLSQVARILRWTTMAESRAELRTRLGTKLAAMQEKARGCASFELTLEVEATLHESFMADVTEHHHLLGIVPLSYSFGLASFTGIGPLEYVDFSVSGWRHAGYGDNCPLSEGELTNDVLSVVNGSKLTSSLNLNLKQGTALPQILIDLGWPDAETLATCPDVEGTLSWNRLIWDDLEEVYSQITHDLMAGGGTINALWPVTDWQLVNGFDSKTFTGSVQSDYHSVSSTVTISLRHTPK